MAKFAVVSGKAASNEVWGQYLSWEPVSIASNLVN